jgi:phage tail sheath protein FI
VVKDHSAVFYPKLRVNDRGLVRAINPSGAIAGLIARTDATRGVWKAPAGTEADLRGVLGLDVRLTDLENGVLNKIGVNCLRSFPAGTVNWGARTMDGLDDLGSEWKYIPIRRLALFLEESLYRGTQWAVFEPNDEPLWANIRLNIGAFMNGLFRQGAFQGSTRDEAFYVKCDAETTTQADRNLGIVNIEIGFAPLKPAEFVVITIQQIAGDLQ